MLRVSVIALRPLITRVSARGDFFCAFAAGFCNVAYAVKLETSCTNVRIVVVQNLMPMHAFVILYGSSVAARRQRTDCFVR